VALFVVALPCVVPVRQSADYVFTTFEPANAAGIGIGAGAGNSTDGYSTDGSSASSGFLFLLGLLGSQWAMASAGAKKHAGPGPGLPLA
jgi:hypothetical protein